MNYTLAPDTEVVSSRYDRASRMCSYTIERGGHRWTVDIHEDDLNRHGYKTGHKQLRRNHLANAFFEAMKGLDDAQKAASRVTAP